MVAVNFGPKLDCPTRQKVLCAKVFACNEHCKESAAISKRSVKVGRACPQARTLFQIRKQLANWIVGPTGTQILFERGPARTAVSWPLSRAGNPTCNFSIITFLRRDRAAKSDYWYQQTTRPKDAHVSNAELTPDQSERRFNCVLSALPRSLHFQRIEVM